MNTIQVDIQDKNVVKADIDVSAIKVSLGSQFKVVNARLQDISVTPTTEVQHICCDEGYNGFRNVEVQPVTADIDSDIVSENIVKGKNILGVEGVFEGGLLTASTPEEFEARIIPENIGKIIDFNGILYLVEE